MSTCFWALMNVGSTYTCLTTGSYPHNNFWKLKGLHMAWSTDCSLEFLSSLMRQDSETHTKNSRITSESLHITLSKPEHHLLLTSEVGLLTSCIFRSSISSLASCKCLATSSDWVNNWSAGHSALHTSPTYQNNQSQYTKLITYLIIIQGVNKINKSPSFSFIIQSHFGYILNKHKVKMSTDLKIVCRARWLEDKNYKW